MTGSEHQDISILKKRGETVMERLRDEFSSIRTGRAVPAILDSIRVNSYGSKVPINHIAGITMEDPRTLRVVPWDKGQVHDIEQAIGDAGLGLSVNVSDVGVRVIFPELTDERRSTLLKLAKGKHEEARISLRQARDDIWGDIQKKEREGAVSEDEKFRLKDQIQKVVDEVNKNLDELFDRKEKEISI